MERWPRRCPSNLTYDWTGIGIPTAARGRARPVHFCHGAGVRVPGAGGAVRELGRAVRGASCAFRSPCSAPSSGLSMRGMANDIYAQVGLVMLIGLAAKNAILIVEFARLSHQRGMPLIEAAIEGARLRLRPILMTSFAFILGALPLAIATGAGANSRQVLGTTVVFGMTAATMIGIFIVPVFYVVLQGLVDRFAKSRASATPAPRAQAEPDT